MASLVQNSLHDSSYGGSSGTSNIGSTSSKVVKINEKLTLEMEMGAVASIDGSKRRGEVVVCVTKEDLHGRGEGVSLTWQDLWVTVSNRKNGCKAILQGMNGYAKPGQLLAIMGPSGCGKSTLLDALAGRLGTNARQSGDVLINGQKQPLSNGTSAYVTQDDTLLSTLTVWEAVYYSALLQLPDSMSKEEKRERAEFTIREMGLQDAVNTRIGGWGAKGISGGQKRRVSVCIEMLTRPRLLFLDEPTSGLDSAASYYVMSRIASLSKRDGIQRTIVASIHQPSSEVFDLFDNLCLLSYGRTIYFGPSSAAKLFFDSNGFICPNHQNPSDYFLKTINKDFEQDPEKELDSVFSAEEAINVLSRSYKESEFSQQTRNEIAEICRLDPMAMEKRRHASFPSQCFTLTRRSFLNMYRDWGYYWLRLAIYFILSLGLATVFFKLGKSYRSIEDRGSLLMFVATFLTFMSIGGFPSFVEDMKVFERERLNGHYGVAAFAIANTVSAVPFLLLISLTSGAIVYKLSHLHEGLDRFLYFITVLFFCMMLVESLMMIVASLVPTYLMGIITGAGIQALMILTGGFFRLPNDLPHILWKYPCFYISFHKYAYQGMFKNEFEGSLFPSDPFGGFNRAISGEEILKVKWEVEPVSKWVDLAILMGMVVLYRVLFLLILKSFEIVKPMFAAYMSAASNYRKTVEVEPYAAPN